MLITLVIIDHNVYMYVELCLFFDRLLVCYLYCGLFLRLLLCLYKFTVIIMTKYYLIFPRDIKSGIFTILATMLSAILFSCSNSTSICFIKASLLQKIIRKLKEHSYVVTN